MSYMAGLVSGDGSGAALAFRNYVVIVEISDTYASVAEIASHTAYLSSFGFCLMCRGISGEYQEPLS